MALGTFDAEPEKSLHRVCKVIQRHRLTRIKTRGAIAGFIKRPTGVDEFVHHLIIGLVGSQSFLDPLAVISRMVQLVADILYPQQISPVVVPVTLIALGLQKFSDQSRPLVWPDIPDESVQFINRRNSTDRIQVDTPTERVVINLRPAFLTIRCKPRLHDLINLVCMLPNFLSLTHYETQGRMHGQQKGGNSNHQTSGANRRRDNSRGQVVGATQ